MDEELHWETVTPLLRSTLTTFMEHDLFMPFRLVGGTSLSLQLGHRMSDDIDLFTDAPYESLNFTAIDQFLRQEFSYVSQLAPGPIGMGVSYLVGNTDESVVKIDLFYTDSFIQPIHEVGPYRLATVEEVIAMKIDIVQRGARKKDFWDLHELLDAYTPAQMIALHEERYPYTHDEKTIRKNFVNFSSADDDFEPVCLKGKYWEIIKLDISLSLQIP